VIAPYVPHVKPGGRPEEQPKRAILNGILRVDIIKVCGVSWPNDQTPSTGGVYAQL